MMAVGSECGTPCILTGGIPMGSSLWEPENHVGKILACPLPKNFLPPCLYLWRMSMWALVHPPCLQLTCIVRSLPSSHAGTWSSALVTLHVRPPPQLPPPVLAGLE